MRVHLIKRQSIENFISENIQSNSAFSLWLLIINRADWNKPQDIIYTFNSADILGDGVNRVVFNIGANKYRLICKYYFGKQKVHLFVKWIGTHADYSKLCKKSGQYDVDAFKY